MRSASPPQHAWWRQPIVWLAAMVLFASLLGCAILIVIGARYADPPLADTGRTVFKVPVAHPPATAQPTPSQ